MHFSKFPVGLFLLIRIIRHYVITSEHVYVNVCGAWSMADDIGELILRTLRERGSADSYDLAVEVGKDHQLLVGAIKSLQSIGDVSHLQSLLDAFLWGAVAAMHTQYI